MRRLGLRQPHQYRNHDRVRFQTAGGFVAFERRRFVPLKNRCREVEAVFAAPVTAGARGEMVQWRRIKQNVDEDVEKEMVDDGHRAVNRNLKAARRG